jgi:hypothetical protein
MDWSDNSKSWEIIIELSLTAVEIILLQYVFPNGLFLHTTALKMAELFFQLLPTKKELPLCCGKFL